MENVGYTVIGFKHAKGEYNGKEYDNFNIHCTRQADPSYDESGLMVEVFKIKASAITSLPEIGEVINPVYDRFGHVVGFNNG